MRRRTTGRVNRPRCLRCLPFPTLGSAFLTLHWHGPVASLPVVLVLVLVLVLDPSDSSSCSFVVAVLSFTHSELRNLQLKDTPKTSCVDSQQLTKTHQNIFHLPPTPFSLFFFATSCHRRSLRRTDLWFTSPYIWRDHDLISRAPTLAPPARTAAFFDILI